MNVTEIKMKWEKIIHCNIELSNLHTKISELKSEINKTRTEHDKYKSLASHEYHRLVNTLSFHKSTFGKAILILLRSLTNEPLEIGSSVPLSKDKNVSDIYEYDIYKIEKKDGKESKTKIVCLHRGTYDEHYIFYDFMFPGQKSLSDTKYIVNITENYDFGKYDELIREFIYYLAEIQYNNGEKILHDQVYDIVYNFLKRQRSKQRQEVKEIIGKNVADIRLRWEKIKRYYSEANCLDIKLPRLIEEYNRVYLEYVKKTASTYTMYSELENAILLRNEVVGKAVAILLRNLTDDYWVGRYEMLPLDNGTDSLPIRNRFGEVLAVYNIYKIEKKDGKEVRTKTVCLRRGTFDETYIGYDFMFPGQKFFRIYYYDKDGRFDRKYKYSGYVVIHDDYDFGEYDEVIKEFIAYLVKIQYNNGKPIELSSCYDIVYEFLQSRENKPKTKQKINMN